MKNPARTLATLAAPTAAAWLTFAAPADAQCFTPDQLTGPCWQFVDLNIPQLPGFSMQGSGLCWTGCQLGQKDCVRIDVDTPQPTQCGQWVSKINVTECQNGLPLMTGTMTLDYTRTWGESDQVGGVLKQYQVWRFCAKVDFNQATPVPPPPICPVPQDLIQTGRSFFYGYVDYALDCNANPGQQAFENAVVLFHNCDHFLHGPLSDVPGVFDPVSTHAIVGPDTPANPFLPAAGLPQPGGPLVGEATRSVLNLAGAFFCQTEDPIAQGFLLPFFTLCFCPLSLNGTQNTLALFEGTTTCVDATGVGGAFEALNFFPQVPWPWLVSTEIGRWSTGNTYPGPEHVWVNEGFFSYRDSCIAVQTPQLNPNSADIFYGAQTERGYPPFSIDPAAPLLLTDKFIDMASNFSHRLGSGPIALPFLGSVRQTDHLIYANTP